MIAPLLIVVLAAVLGYFYPAYAPDLPFHVPMAETEAHILGIYLAVVGLDFLLITRRGKAAASRPSNAPGNGKRTMPQRLPTSHPDHPPHD